MTKEELRAQYVRMHKYAHKAFALYDYKAGINVHKRQSSLAEGQMVCRDAVKGMVSLIGSGTVEDDPAAVATFLRDQRESLDSTQLGEYFGHHEEQAVSSKYACNFWRHIACLQTLAGDLCLPMLHMHTASCKRAQV